MSMETDRVDQLSAVTLRLEAGTSPERMDLTPEPVGADFIFGIGGDGLTPFEYALADKAPGDEVLLQVVGGEAPATFGHLMSMLPAAGGDFYLKARVEAVRPAEGREVVQAMASLAACGDGCCGDFCCGH